MNKNTVIGFLLIFGILIGFSIFNAPSKKELESQKKYNDSVALVHKKINDSIVLAQAKAAKNPEATLKPQKDSAGTIAAATATATATADTQATVLKQAQLGVFSGSSMGKEEFYTIENELLKVKISSKGGKICSVELKKYKTYDSLPLIMFDEKSSEFGITFFANNRDINTKELYFKPHFFNAATKDSVYVSGNNSVNFSMRIYPDIDTVNKNKYIEFLYTLKGNSYMLGYKINIVGLKDVIAPNINYISFDWKAKLLRKERSLSNEQNSSTIYYKYYQDEVDFMSETKDGEKSLETNVKWIGFKQQFFTSVIIAENSFDNAKIKTVTDKSEKNNRFVKTMSTEISIPYNSSVDNSFPMQFYFGPNKYKTLRQYKIDMERQIPLGWSFFLMQWINRYAVIPVFNFLESYNINYGIIILILTVLLKIVLFPIAYKTYKSSAKIKVLKPELDEIGKKYPKSEDTMKKQKETMALYKKAGVNPMAGCVPQLLQFPILIALFRFFPASFELRQQGFLWAKDLSSYDSIMNLPFNIPYYGDHVSLFCLLMTISTIIYTMVNNQMMPSSQQMPGMKVMMYLMPIMFLGFFNSFASALSYYYFLANVLTFGQMYIIRQFIDEGEIHRQIQEYKNNPKAKKTSSWAKRMEEMAKKRGYKIP